MKNNLRKIINILFPFVDYLYILQLEEYNIISYLQWINNRIFKRNFQKVGKIVWTKKATVIFIVSIILYIFVVGILMIFSSSSIIYKLFFLIIIIGCTIPLLIALSTTILYPIDWFLKYCLINRAKSKLNKLNQSKIIVIAGSYGKTTTRSFIYQILQGKFKIHTTKDNINTIVGLAKDIIDNINSNTSIYLVEIGEYRKGDFKKFLEFLPRPQIAILTAVGPQHISTFHSQENVDEEFVAFLKLTEQSIQYVNEDNVGVKRVINHLVDNNPILYTKSNSQPYFNFFHPEILKNPNAMQSAAVAIMIAEHFGLNSKEIGETLTKLELPERRLKLRKSGSFSIIDDSYNINPDSADSALSYLSTFEGRKIIITGGIVDQGKHFAQRNVEFGEKIAKIADIVVIAKNNFSNLVKKGVGQIKSKIKIIESPDPKETPKILRSILQPNDTILIQNELPDLYWH